MVLVVADVASNGDPLWFDFWAALGRCPLGSRRRILIRSSGGAGPAPFRLGTQGERSHRGKSDGDRRSRTAEGNRANGARKAGRGHHIPAGLYTHEAGVARMLRTSAPTLLEKEPYPQHPACPHTPLSSA